MKTHWPAISFLVILGFAVGVQVMAALEPAACYANALAFWSSEQKVPIFSCWEFWLNRYQGLIGNLITAGVAYLTLRWIRKQLITSDRQTAVSAAQALRQRVADLKRESERLADVQTRARAIRSKLLDAIVPRRKFRRAILEDLRKEVADEANEIAGILQDFYTDVLTESRAIVVGAGLELRHHIRGEFTGEIYAHLFADTDLQTPFEDDIVRTTAEFEEIEAIMIKVHSRIRRFVEMTDAAKQSVRADLERTWGQIRAFENEAIG